MIEFMAAVNAAPQRVFSMKEVCEILCCKPYRSTVDQYIYAAIADGQVFKREVDGAMYYCGSPVSDALLAKIGITVQPRNGTGALIRTRRAAEEVEAAMAHVRAPKMDPTWKPPQMVAPRPGSDVKVPRVAPAAAPPPPQAKSLEEIESAIDRANEGLIAKLRERPVPEPEPVSESRVEPDHEAAEASILEGAGTEEEPEEKVEFNAAMWLDGDLVIYGAVELEDGGMLIAKENLAKLRQLITWSALP
jgi:hypothetical protein